MRHTEVSTEELNPAQGTHSLSVEVLREATSVVPSRRSRRVPFSIPKDQAYYWTTEWQKSIQESHAELRFGKYVDFDDPNDPDAVVRWLLSDED